MAAGTEPCASTFAALENCWSADPNQNVPDYGTDIPEGQFNAKIGQPGRRAHDLALVWKLTGNDAYAKKAVEFVNAASHFKTTSWRGTAPLDHGKIFLLVEAAEILRDSPLWAAEDKARFNAMLRNLFLPHIKNGDAARFGNQGLFALRGTLAIAIYLDDEDLFDRVWRILNAMPHRPGQEPFVKGPPMCDAAPVSVGEYMEEYRFHGRRGEKDDYFYDESLKYYIYANGQCQESSRDQGHCICGVMSFVAIAEMFWNQGRDLYSQLDNRILSGLEWNLRYNLSGDWKETGYTQNENEATFANDLYLRLRSRSGRWRSLKPSAAGRGNYGGSGAPRTEAWMHYAVRAGVAANKMEYLSRAIAANADATGGIEDWGTPPNWYYEWTGWGTLTKWRTKWMRGDPCRNKSSVRIPGAHAIPGTIRARDFDYNPIPERTSRRKYPDKWTSGDFALYTVTSASAQEVKVSIAYSAVRPATVAMVVDSGTPVTRTLQPAKKGKCTFGRLQIPAGASVVRFAVVDSDYGFVPAGFVLDPAR